MVLKLLKLLRDTRAAIAAMSGLGNRLKTIFADVQSNMKAT
jgi:hypothetical protein